jgi:hypothetical protein
LAALEAMAFGKVVVTGVDGSGLYAPFRARGLLDDSPLIFASPSNLFDVLLPLVDAPLSLVPLGRRTRKYAEERHGPHQTARLFKSVYQTLKQR